jgi:hypothetical protein
VKLVTKDGAFVEYSLAEAVATIPEESYYMEPLSKFVYV